MFCNACSKEIYSPKYETIGDQVVCCLSCVGLLVSNEKDKCDQCQRPVWKDNYYIFHSKNYCSEKCKVTAVKRYLKQNTSLTGVNIKHIQNEYFKNDSPIKNLQELRKEVKELYNDFEFEENSNNNRNSSDKNSFPNIKTIKSLKKIEEKNESSEKNENKFNYNYNINPNYKTNSINNNSNNNNSIINDFNSINNDINNNINYENNNNAILKNDPAKKYNLIPNKIASIKIVDNDNMNNSDKKYNCPRLLSKKKILKSYRRVRNNYSFDNKDKVLYDINDMENINNFKHSCNNYNKSIGNINKGLDYEKNERNIYDLYIPKYAEKRKNEINGIILWIHGGSWIGGDLKQVDILCQYSGQLGYISATVGYTILIDYYKVFNIFKILDEITACIKAIKKELASKGFDENKLQLALGGYSAGGHLALLYSYLIKDINIIPIKFIIDIVGPVGLDPKYFYQLKSPLESLENIEDISIIEQAKKDGKIVKMLPDLSFLELMNAFSGNKYNILEIGLMLDINGNINYESPNYLKMYNEIKYGYVTEIEDKHKLPTICVYGGIDNVIGVSTYAYLKEKAGKDGRHLDFIYSRNEGHLLIFPTTIDGQQQVLKMNALIKNYCEKYFQ